MKHIMLAFILTSFMTPANAASFECMGKTISETLTFRTMTPAELKNNKRGIFLVSLNSKLCDGYVSIDSRNEEPYALVAQEKDISGKKTAFYDWNGNWGYEIKIPNVIFEKELTRNETFRINYKFTYDDIAEAEVVRTLNCKKK